MPDTTANVPSAAAEPAEHSYPDILANTAPVNFRDERYADVFRKLQGNILKGHGRDYSANIFLKFSCEGAKLQTLLRQLTVEYVTSALQQMEEAEQFHRFGVPGALFGTLLLSSRAYQKLGHGDRLEELFEVKPEGDQSFQPQKVNFVNGMRAGAEELGDRPELISQHNAEPLEMAYLNDEIDALLILADDAEEYLLRKTREFITRIESQGQTRVLAVELGKALRNEEGEGIEHFGYVDGRSQPLFLTSDFRNLRADGTIDPKTTTEKVNDKAQRRESGALDHWNPFARLDLALLRDPAVKDPHAFGSYFVFRKLEQDVLRFSIAEQQLADALKLTGADRARAGAMAVGRFRDGTPLVLSETGGMIPAKSNNFRYDGLNPETLEADPQVPTDMEGMKCPFHAHIRKTNPRQSVPAFAPSVEEQEEDDLGRRIVRRGIPYGTRVKHPSAFQSMSDLPEGGVGLLFACYQRSIIRQFAFMQKAWANNVNFRIAQAGIDPLIGQSVESLGGNPDPTWRKEYGETTTGDEQAPVSFPFSNFVRFRGGEFFFAPSLAFLLGEESNAPATA